MQKCSNAGYESKIFELQEQIKKMYSEEEVLKLLNDREDYMNSEDNIFDYQTNKEWFNKFKKK